MKEIFSASAGLCLASLLGLSLALPLTAEGTKEKMSNVQGMVHSLDKSGMTLTVMKGNLRQEVIYSADTKFRYGHSKSNKPGSIDDVKAGFFLSCSGAYEPGKVQLQAKQCVYRENK